MQLLKEGMSTIRIFGKLGLNYLVSYILNTFYTFSKSQF